MSGQHHDPPKHANRAGRGAQGARPDRDEVEWLIRLEAGEGCLPACCVTHAEATDVDRQAGRVHAQIDVRLGLEVAHQLAKVVPDGWDVSTGCLWVPARSDGLLLHPGVVVHRALEPGGGLSGPPTLCVSITSGCLDPRSARPYARFGVDHYWHLDSRSGALEVLVRVDDEYRHAETITVSSTSPGADDEAVEWVDFGIGVLRLSVQTGARHSGVPSGA